MYEPKTRRELIDQVLANLRVLAYGQAPAAEEIAKVDGIVDPALAELATDEIAYVADPGRSGPLSGEIDPAQFLSLADYIAFRVAPQFGLAGDAALAALSSQAKDKLRSLNRPPGTQRTLSVDRALTFR